MLGAGLVFQQRAAEQAPQRDYLKLRLIADLVRDRRWLAGLAIMIAGQLLSAWVFGHLVLSVVEPLLASNLLFALLLAWPLARQKLSGAEVWGALVLVAGVTALSVARTSSAATISVGSPSNWPFVACGVAVVAAGFAAAGRRRTGKLRASLTGIAAGVTFGMQDALTRLVVRTLTGHGVMALLTSWPGYGLVVVGLTGLWLMESSFNAGPLHTSLPPIAAAEPATGIVVGIVAFGDRLAFSPGLLALQAGGFACLVLGVILVGRGPALAAACGPRPETAGEGQGHHGRALRPAGRHRQRLSLSSVWRPASRPSTGPAREVPGMAGRARSAGLGGRPPGTPGSHRRRPQPGQQAAG